MLQPFGKAVLAAASLSPGERVADALRDCRTSCQAASLACLRTATVTCSEPQVTGSFICLPGTPESVLGGTSRVFAADVSA